MRVSPETSDEERAAAPSTVTAARANRGLSRSLNRNVTPETGRRTIAPSTGSLDNNDTCAYAGDPLSTTTPNSTGTTTHNPRALMPGP